MNNSNDDPNKVGSYSRLSPEDEKAEDEELKTITFINLRQNHAQHKKPSNNRKKSTVKVRADGVKIPGICPDCRGKLKPYTDRLGDNYTVCENYSNGCDFYVPHDPSHF